MHILVTNDDGIHAPGLLALAQSMKQLGKVTVFAPDRNWSASGHVKTMHRPLRIQTVQLTDGTPAFTSDGAPSDCVALALLGAVSEKIDLVVSGINPHANLGHDVTYSGTVTAAMEAVIAGIPGIAFSLDSYSESYSEIDFGPAAQVAKEVAASKMYEEIPAGTLISVNIPQLPAEDIKGWKITRQGLRIYRDRLDRRKDPRGREYYWIGGEMPTGVPENGTDVGVLSQGYVSITPLKLDLTDFKAIETLNKWNKN